MCTVDDYISRVWDKCEANLLCFHHFQTKKQTEKGWTHPFLERYKDFVSEKADLLFFEGGEEAHGAGHQLWPRIL